MLYLPARDWLTYKYKKMFASAKIYAYILSSLYVAAHKRKRNARVNHFMNLCYCTHFGTECVCEQGRAAREVHRGHQEQDPDVGRGGRVPVSSYYDIVYIVQYS